MNAEAAIREFIAKQLIHEPGRDLSPDHPLLEEAVIDSTGILDLVSWLEETFGVEVQDDEIVPENFETIRSIVTFLEGKRLVRPG
jgi:acyl carrier protein